jgi:hypothetical protein
MTTAAAVLLALVAVAPTAAQGRVFVPRCGSSSYGGFFKPHRWDPACTGGSHKLRVRKWRGWGSRVAVARGHTTIRICDPDCPRAYFVKYRARLRLSRIRQCKGASGETRRFYTRARITFFVDEPAGGLKRGKRRDRLHLGCER